MQSRMMEELIEALEGYRLEASINGTYVTLDDIGRHMRKGGSRSALYRITSGETHNSRYVDELVDAYSRETKATPIQVWGEALAEWMGDPNGRTYEARRASTRQALEELRYLAMLPETGNSQ